MTKFNSYVIGKLKKNKLDGTKYELTDKLKAVLDKGLEVENNVGIYYVDSDGKLDSVQLNGQRIAKNVEFPKFKEEGTYSADVLLAIGTAFAFEQKEKYGQLRFATRGRDNKSLYYNIKCWENYEELAKEIQDGNHPKIYIVAQISMYNDKPQYTMLEWGKA